MLRCGGEAGGAWWPPVGMTKPRTFAGGFYWLVETGFYRSVVFNFCELSAGLNTAGLS